MAWHSLPPSYARTPCRGVQVHSRNGYFAQEFSEHSPARVVVRGKHLRTGVSRHVIAEKNYPPRGLRSTPGVAIFFPHDAARRVDFFRCACRARTGPTKAEAADRPTDTWLTLMDARTF